MIRNGSSAIVRRLVGYGRFVGARQHLFASMTRCGCTSISSSLSFKSEKTRIGADQALSPAVPPVERMMAHLEVAEIDKERLRATRALTATRHGPNAHAEFVEIKRLDPITVSQGV